MSFFNNSNKNSFIFRKQAERQSWLAFHKKKWAWQRERRKAEGITCKKSKSDAVSELRPSTSTLGGFLKKAQHALLTNTWQIIQVHLIVPGYLSLFFFCFLL